MRIPRHSRFLVPAIALCAVVACKNNDTTTAPGGALASITVQAPGSANSGQPFAINVTATDVGVAGVHHGLVMASLPAPLGVVAINASAGTSATFSGGSVTWTLGTLDSNTSSSLTITAAGSLPQGSAAQNLTIQATLTADGINAGDAVAQATVQLNP